MAGALEGIGFYAALAAATARAQQDEAHPETAENDEQSASPVEGQTAMPRSALHAPGA